MSDEPISSERVASELCEALNQRFAEHDRAGAVALAHDAVHSGRIGVDEFYTRVLGPLLTDTGASWQHGDIQVWEEHFATATARTIVEELFLDVIQAAKDVPRNGRCALLATPAEESHDLGLRMLADRLMLAGWKVFYLGADTPALQVSLAAEAVGADLVVLSIATHYNRALLRSQIDEIKYRLPDVQIGVGGPAFSIDRSWPEEELLTPADLGLPDYGSGG